MKKNPVVNIGILLFVIASTVVFYLFMPVKDDETSTDAEFSSLLFPVEQDKDMETDTMDSPHEEYEHGEMRGFSGVDPEVLHREFPGNTALPAMTPQDLALKNSERERRDRLYGRIVSNRASVDEVHRYYGEQSRLTSDTVELLEFILENHADSLAVKQKKRYTFLLELYKKRLDVIPHKEKEAMERINRSRE